MLCTRTERGTLSCGIVDLVAQRVVAEDIEVEVTEVGLPHTIESETTCYLRNSIAQALEKRSTILVTFYLGTARVKSTEEFRRVVLYVTTYMAVSLCCQAPLTIIDEVASARCRVEYGIETLLLVAPKLT